MATQRQFFVAITLQDVELATKMLTEDPGLANTIHTYQNSYDLSALMYAAYTKNVAMIRLLLKCNANIHYRSMWGGVYAAARDIAAIPGGSPEIVALIDERSAQEARWRPAKEAFIAAVVRAQRHNATHGTPGTHGLFATRTMYK